MRILLKVLFILSLLFTSINANTMFLLTKVPKAYLVVENYSSKIPMEIKEDILEEMQNTADELNIDTSGYSHRTLAFIMYESYLDDTLILNIDLVLGEEAKRLDDKKEVYALTYEKRKQMTYGQKDVEELEEELLGHIEQLLYDFSEQYKDDNEKPDFHKVKDYRAFAKEFGYETDYKKALAKAKSENKQVMFVMVANFCPWCIKLEKKVLSDKGLNEQIHKKYIPLILNREEGNFPKQFKAPVIPTVFFVDSKDESIVTKNVGYNNRYKFISIINK